MATAGWTCLGDGPPHPADIEAVERTWGSPHGNQIGIHRCRTCGQLYRYLYYEVNDWTASADYTDETSIWQVLDADEVDSVRSDPNYSPRSDRMHRSDTGWIRQGP